MQSVLTLGGRARPSTTLAALTVAAVAAGLFFGWNSLAALGLTTFIVSLLPCLAMCALGVCAARMSKGRSDTPPAVPSNEVTQKEKS